MTGGRSGAPHGAGQTPFRKPPQKFHLPIIPMQEGEKYSPLLLTRRQRAFLRPATVMPPIGVCGCGRRFTGQHAQRHNGNVPFL